MKDFDTADELMDALRLSKQPWGSYGRFIFRAQYESSARQYTLLPSLLRTPPAGSYLKKFVEGSAGWFDIFDHVERQDIFDDLKRND